MQFIGCCYAGTIALILLQALHVASTQSSELPSRQQLDDTTCRLLCSSCENTRLVYQRQCATAANATAHGCPCLQVPVPSDNEENCSSVLCPTQKQGRAAELADCPEPQPPPPPPNCAPGGSVRCLLVGQSGRCYGNCTCLTPTPTPCPADPCPASNCRAYAESAAAPGCRRLCSDCGANPWWCFGEPPDNCGNATDACGDRGFRRNSDGCQVDCRCAESSLPLTPACRLPHWLRASCRRFCRRLYGGDGRLQTDERGCERCRCCGQPCEDRWGSSSSSSRRHRRPSRCKLDAVTGCPSCHQCEEHNDAEY